MPGEGILKAKGVVLNCSEVALESLSFWFHHNHESQHFPGDSLIPCSSSWDLSPQGDICGARNSTIFIQLAQFSCLQNTKGDFDIL